MQLISKSMQLEDYLLLDQSSSKKHEFCDGEVVCLGGETEPHDLIASNIVCEMGGIDSPYNFNVFPSSSYRVATPGNKGYFYPDATIVDLEPEVQGGLIDTLFNPVIIFEVMSETTYNNDRGYKFFFYKDILALQEYVLIDSTRHFIEVIKRHSKNAWKFEQFLTPDCTITLESIDYSLKLSNFYFQVSFE